MPKALLTSDTASCFMRSPNYERPLQGLPDSPKSRAYCIHSILPSLTLLHPAAGVFAHIRQAVSTSGLREDPAASHKPGSVETVCLFLIPVNCEVSHV